MRKSKLDNPLIISMKNNIRQYTMFLALIGLMIIFTVLTEGVFIKSRNLTNLLLQTSTIAVLASGVVLVIVAGHIDLSIGSVVGFTGAIAAILNVKMGIGTISTIIITLGVGALIGLWQGYWVAYRKVPAFIVTLAGMMVFKGALMAVTQGETISKLDNSLKGISQNYIPTFLPEFSIFGIELKITTIIIGLLAVALYIFLELRKRKERIKYEFEVFTPKVQLLKMVLISLGISIIFIVMGMYKGIPYSIIVLAAVGVLYTFLTRKTKFGRYVYAIGGNKEAAKLSGINIKIVNLWIFISMGILGALGGILYTARLDAATAAAGQSMELDVIAAAIIGGTSTMGGQGTIVGAIIGALVMGTLDNGLGLMSAPIELKYIIKGLILLLAVWVDISSRKNNN